MTEKVFQPTPDFAKNAHANKEKYELMYTESVSNPDAFGESMANALIGLLHLRKLKILPLNIQTYQ